MAPFQQSEWVFHVTVPLLCIVFFIVKQLFKRLKVSECVALFAAITIEIFSRLIIGYSLWPYVLFGFVWIGLIMLFVNYKTNHYFTVAQFFRKYITVLSIATVLVSIGLSAYRLVVVFLIK